MRSQRYTPSMNAICKKYRKRLPPSERELTDLPLEKAIKETAATKKGETTATTETDEVVAKTTTLVAKTTTNKTTPTVAKKLDIHNSHGVRFHFAL